MPMRMPTHLMGRKRYWTKDRIIEEILHRYNEGLELNYSGLYADGLGSMYVASRQVFGSWSAAIKAAGVSAEVGSRRHHEKSWTKNKILAEIMRRERADLGLVHTQVVTTDRSLSNAAVRAFGSWRKAVVQAGIDYDEIAGLWDRDASLGVVFEYLVEELFIDCGLEFERHARFKPKHSDRQFIEPDFVFPGNHWWDAKLNSYSLHVDECIDRYRPHAASLTIVFCRGGMRDHQAAKFVLFDDLLEQQRPLLEAKRQQYFKRKIKRIREAKISQTRLRKWAVKWSWEAISDQIRAIDQAGESLLAKHVRDAYPQLYGAVMSQRKEFASWYDAVTKAGFDGEKLKELGFEERSKTRTIFTKEYCMERLLELERAGADLSNRGLFDSESSLAAALRRNWGSVTAALENVGIDPEGHRRQLRWTPNLVIDRLRERARSVQAINPGAISKQDANLYQAAVRHFGTLENAASKAGLTLPRFRKGASWFSEDGRFDKKLFAKAVRKWLSDGQSLILTEVLATNPSLVSAARKYMDGWYQALSEFGYDVGEIRKGARAKTKKWSKSKVCKKLVILAGQGVDISHSGLRHGGYLDLLGACVMYFDGWAPALRAAGLDPSEHRRNPSRSTKWSRAKIISRIKELHDVESDLSVTGVSKNQPLLYASAVRNYFDSWSEALRASGIDPESVKRGPPKWTKKAIIEGLKECIGDDQVIVPSVIKDSNPQLYDVIFRQFNNLDHAVEEAGLVLQRQRRSRWSDEEIIDEIRALYERGVPLWWNAIRQSHVDLSSAAVAKHHFGTWRAAIEAAGLDYESILRQGARSRNRSQAKWSKQSIIAAIRQRVADGKSLRPSVVIKDEKGIYVAAGKKNYFGSWRAAVMAAGFKYEDYMKGRRSPRRRRN
jgi:hypothetical protein